MPILRVDIEDGRGDTVEGGFEDGRGDVLILLEMRVPGLGSGHWNVFTAVVRKFCA